jgi:hypothetical protein
MQIRVLVFSTLPVALVACKRDAQPPPPAAETAAPKAMAPTAPTAEPTMPSALANPYTQQTPAPAKGADGAYALGSLRLTVPDTWSSQPLSNAMRRAQFIIPAAAGDTEGAELVVFHFGQQGAGSVDANLERWYGQFQQSDGRPSREVAKVEKLAVLGAEATLVDVSGRYVAAMTPGAAAGGSDKPGFRMLGAIVEADDGAYYFKLVGPAATVGAAADAFRAAIAGLTTAGQ